jgi:translation initiation factor 2 beta subunit (eIF-2beta)/eIF-5
MGIESQDDNTIATKKCSSCGGQTYKENTKWGEYEHWYGTSDSLICKRCFLRSRWQNRFVPINVKCDRCQRIETKCTKYGTPRWVRDREKENGYLCWSCYIIKRNTGRVVTKQTRDNQRAAAIRAQNAGVFFGRRVHAVNESIFDNITEDSAYWIGFLMADGYIEVGKHGSPRIAITLAKEDLQHLDKFATYLQSTYNILEKKVHVNGKVIIQYTLRFSSKKIADVLATYGVVPKKSHIAKVIDLKNNRHFWRGVLDGDGWLGNRNGHDGDKIVLVGSHDLLYQFKEFMEKNIPEAVIKIKPVGKYWRLYVYGNTARMLAKLLYDNCHTALDRKLAKAQRMIGYIQ